MTIPVTLTSRAYDPALGQFITTYTEVIATFQAAVATQADLPLIGNTLYDARIALDDNYLYVWNGTSWVSIGASDVYDYVVDESIPGQAPAMTFKESVVNEAALPLIGNSLNDARITNNDGHLYIWNGTTWLDQGDIIDFQWSALEDGPSSSVANIDDAVSKRHTQGTDQGLDTGGINASTAAQVKGAVTNSHAPHSDDQDLSGKVDKVTGSSLVPDTEIAKIHSQNTDLYLNTQITHKFYVDGNRTDTYVEDGSFTKPFKKIQDAINAATGATVYNRITIQIMPGQYIEQIVMKQWVHLVSLVPDSVWIQSAAGDVVTTSVDANMTNLGITYTGTDNTKLGLRCKNGAVVVARETNIYANYSGIVLEAGAIFISYGGGTLTGEADSFIVKNGAYAAFYGTVLSGWGDPYYDLVIEAGGYVDVMDVQLYSERLNNLGTLNLVTPASRIKNAPAGNITATDVQAAINELDTEKQSSLGFTPENVANKDTDGTMAANSDTKYPSQRAVKNYIDILNDNVILNLMLNAFLIAHQSSLTIFKMVKGFVDVFANESGIDLVNSINQTYDSENEIYKNYDEIDAETKLLLHLDNTEEDETGKTVTNNDVTFSSVEKKFGTHSAVFNGSSSYLSVPDSDDFAFGTGYFTIDFWIKTPSDFTAKVVFSQSQDASNFMQFGINTDVADSLTLGVALNDNWVIYLHGSYVWTNEVWHHVAIVRNGTTLNTTKIYVDGVALTGTLASGSWDYDYSNLTGTFNIGKHPYLGGYFYGYMDEFRVSKGIARWATDFTPPTQSVPFAIAMTLISNEQVADIIPTLTRLVVYEEDVDAITLNTDLIAYLSRDNGVTWTQGTLVYGGNSIFNINILDMIVDVSSQPADTDIVYKLVTTDKKLKIHGVSMSWN